MAGNERGRTESTVSLPTANLSGVRPVGEQHRVRRLQASPRCGCLVVVASGPHL